MDKATELEVRARARHTCEYCRLPERFSKLPFTIDHIISRQHGGADGVDNLALACGICNRHKGPNIAGFDPLSRIISPLFHPREHIWSEHFRWEGAAIIGVTPIGRTTVMVLAVNLDLQLSIRRALIDEGLSAFFS